MSTTVFCIATTEHQAQDIAKALRENGFASDDISVLFSDRKGSRDFAHEQHTKAPEGAIAGVGTGGAIGGALGWVIGIGALAIPGVGPFIAAGPIMALLAGAAVGATVGGITGALVGMGIPEIEAKQYAGKIKAGNILLSVHTTNSAEITNVKQIFRDAKAQDISSTTEASVKGTQAKTQPEKTKDKRYMTTASGIPIAPTSQTRARGPERRL